jgi:F-type H+-transporting ATPase subunit O
MSLSVRLLVAARRPLAIPLRNVSPPTMSVRSMLIQLQPILIHTQRSYAAAPQKGPKPPIAIHSLEGTYASALFSASAQNMTVLNEIEKSLFAIREKLRTDPKLQSVVVNPALSHQEKMDVVQLLTLTGGGGAEATKSIRNLLEVMSENGRLGRLDDVVNDFERITRAYKGEVDVIVTSAQVCLVIDVF